MCPSSLDTGIAIIFDKTRLQKWRNIIEQMMHHPVAELSGKYFPHLGIVDNETRSRINSLSTLRSKDS